MWFKKDNAKCRSVEVFDWILQNSVVLIIHKLDKQRIYHQLWKLIEIIDPPSDFTVDGPIWSWIYNMSMTLSISVVYDVTSQWVVLFNLESQCQLRWCQYKCSNCMTLWPSQLGWSVNFGGSLQWRCSNSMVGIIIQVATILLF